MRRDNIRDAVEKEGGRRDGLFRREAYKVGSNYRHDHRIVDAGS